MGTVSLALRMLLSLVVVLVLLFIAARFTRRGRPRGGGPEITVVSRVTVGSKASVAVVRLADRAFVVGVTDQSVTLLTEGPASELIPLPEASADNVRVVRRNVTEDALAGTETPVEGGHRPLEGSALSPATWRRTVDAVRDLTVRR
jgi:flagellar protein FliO/FliZ